MDPATGSGIGPSYANEAPLSSWPAGVPRPRRVFLAGLVLFTLLLVGHNRHLFTQPIHEDGDYAANSILITQAKRLNLLVGNYSRLGFNHPGPALLYVQAFSELVFHDLLGLVPAPHNAHVLGSLLLNALLLALVLAILHGHFRSLPAVAVAAAVLVGYFAVNGQLARHWMPCVYFAPFLLLVVAAGSVACGRPRHLPWLALAGGLLVHGHVCFVAFVVPLALYALAALAFREGFAVRRLFRAHAGSFLAFAAVVGLFVLPITLHTLLHFPGEMARYLNYVGVNHPEHPLKGVVQFMLQVFTNEAGHPRLVALAVLAAVAVAVPWRCAGPVRRYTVQALIACALTSAMFLYYALRGVDDLKYTYTGIFFGSVLLTLLTVAAMNVAMRFDGDRRRGWVLGSLAVAAIGVLGVTAGPGFTNVYAGSPFVDAVAAEEASVSGPPIIVTHDYMRWADAAGFVMAMERRGRRVFVAENHYALDVLYTSRYARGLEELAGARHLDFARPDEPSARIRCVLYQNDEVSVRELDARYTPGTPISFTDSGDWEVFKGRGWVCTGTRAALTNGPEACLALELASPLAGDAVLSATARPCGSAFRPGLRVDVLVNGERVARWRFADANRPAELRAPVPASLLDRAGPVRITFRIPAAGSSHAQLFMQTLCLAASPDQAGT